MLQSECTLLSDDELTQLAFHGIQTPSRSAGLSGKLMFFIVPGGKWLEYFGRRRIKSLGLSPVDYEIRMEQCTLLRSGMWALECLNERTHVKCLGCMPVSDVVTNLFETLATIASVEPSFKTTDYWQEGMMRIHANTETPVKEAKVGADVRGFIQIRIGYVTGEDHIVYRATIAHRAGLAQKASRAEYDKLHQTLQDLVGKRFDVDELREHMVDALEIPDWCDGLSVRVSSATDNTASILVEYT